MVIKSLYWKGILAFALVALVAVGTVALLAGHITETEFRRYAFVHTENWNQPVRILEAYYRDHGTWSGVQDALQQAQARWAQGRGKGRGADGYGPPKIGFRLADTAGHVVADTDAAPTGRISQALLLTGIPLTVDGETVGYLLPVPHTAMELDARQAQFLHRIYSTLWLAALAAMGAALLIGGVLFRSIIAPLRQLTEASRAVAAGDFSVRAQVQGQDEVAQLAQSFNRMAESLTQAEQARRHQTADIAHELRTPLTVLQGALEAMLDGIYPTNRENLEAALAQVKTLSRLVADLRLLAQADAGQLRLYPAPLELAEFLSASVDAHRLQAQERGVTLEVKTPSAPLPVLADRERLAQVMGNLLTNALRYVPAGGHVTVEAAALQAEAQVTVRDNGPGVPPEDLPHLFERFWRGDRARQRSTGGSGLGLTIARQIVQAHHGRIWAAPAPGGGLAITFSLPRAQNPTDTSSEATQT